MRRNSSYPQGSPKVAALTARLHRRRPAHARFMRKCTSTSQWRVNGTPQRLASRVSFRPNLADSNMITVSGGQLTDSIVLKQATSSTSGGGSGVRRPPVPSKNTVTASIYVEDVKRSTSVVLVVQRFGVGLVIERSLVRLPAGALSSQLT